MNHEQNGEDHIGVSQAHPDLEAPPGVPPLPQRQMRLPGYSQFKRVQQIMEKDDAVSRCLGPRTHAAETASGKTVLFSGEAVEVAKVLYSLSRDGKKESIPIILKTAAYVLRAKLKQLVPETKPPSTSEPECTSGEARQPANVKRKTSETDKSEPQTNEIPKEHELQRENESVSMSVSIPVLVKSEDKSTVEYWIEQLTQVHASTIAGLIVAGRILIEAKESLDHGDWLRMVQEGHLPYNERIAQYLMQIARHQIISNPNNHSFLPESRSALVELAKGDETKVEQAIIDKKIHPAMSAKEVRLLALGGGGKSDEAGTSKSAQRNDAKIRERRLNSIRKILEETESWVTDQRSQFVAELKKLVAALV